MGFGQEVRVNTLANEVFSHDIARDLDNMIANVEAVIEMEGIVSTLEGLIKKETDPGNLDSLNDRPAASLVPGISLTFCKSE